MGAMTDPLTLAFIGRTGAGGAAQAARFEDVVLALLGNHGGELLFRGRRAAGEPESKPAEIHVIRFPDQMAMAAYLDDPQRLALLAEYGEVFTSKEVVALDPVTGPLA